MYEPREDTRLLKKVLKDLDLDGDDLLEIGSGKGEIGLKAWRKGAEVTLTDIDPEAVRHLRHKTEGKDKVRVIESDLFENVDGSYDKIFFNPPYLPGDRESENDPLNGGNGGTEVLNRFLEEHSNYMKQDGVCYFVFSSKTDEEDLRRRSDFQVVDSERLWFETLYVAKTG